MASQIATTMAAILPLVEARLRQITGLGPEAVLPWVGSGLPPHAQADRDLILRLRGFTPDSGWQAGGGRYTPRVSEVLEVVVRTRLWLDETTSARQWLEEATLGHISMRSLVLDALLDFFPTDDDDNSLVTDGLKLRPAQAPQKDDARGATADWGSEVLAFEVSYVLALTLPEA